jgi:hypothetical protein
MQIHILIDCCDNYANPSDERQIKHNADTLLATHNLIRDIVYLAQEHYGLTHYNDFKGSASDPVLIAGNTCDIFQRKPKMHDYQ